MVIGCIMVKSLVLLGLKITIDVLEKNVLNQKKGLKTLIGRGIKLVNMRVKLEQFVCFLRQKAMIDII